MSETNMEKREDAIKAITTLTGDRITAELVIDRLQELGYTQLGYGNGDVDAIISAFVETFGTTKSTKMDRFAANRLAKKYGAQSVVGIIRLFASLSNDEYAPVIGSVAQLEDKWVSMLTFVRKRSQQRDGEVIQT